MRFSRLSLLFCLLVFLCGALCNAGRAATFSGKVVSPDGVPVAGAKLWAGALGLTQYSEKEGTIKVASTNAEGVFSFDIDVPKTAANFAFLRVQADKFAIEDTVLKPGDQGVKLSLPTTVRGIVKNAKGEPVPDVPVQVVFAPGSMQAIESDLQGGGMNVFISLMGWTSSLTPQEGKSGADGKWAIETGKSSILAINDPRFARAFGMAGMGGVRGVEDSGFVTMVAQPGATLKGSLLTTEGKPLKDAYIIGASGIFGSPTKVAADGSFLMDRMPPGPATLIGISSDPDWIVAPLQITQPLEAGKTTEAPAWKASKGIELTGTVINKKTGKPLADIGVSSVIGGTFKTDANGQFKMRVSPQMGMVQIVHPDYAPFMKNFDKMGDGPTFDAGQLAIEPAIKIKGRLLDAAGQPVKNIGLLGTVKQEPGNFMPSLGNAMTDDKGAFEMRLANGSITLTIQDKKWELEAGPYYEFKLDEKTAPLELKAKKLVAQKASGRIVRPNGLPVAGATVIAQITKPDPPAGAVYFSSQDQASSETDAEGRFALEVYGAAKEVKISKVEGESYLMRQSGIGKKEGNDWKVSDTIVALLNATVKGRVLNAKGAPAAGAWVASPESAFFAPIQTDGEGNFTLEKLPEGAAVIFAAQDKDFVRGAAKNETIELQLAPPGRFITPMRRQFFQQAAKDGVDSLFPYWNAVGSDKMLAFALQSDGALTYGETTTNGADWNQAGKNALNMLANSFSYDAAWLRTSGFEALGKVPADKNDDERFKAEGALAAALAFGDDKQRGAAKQWLDFESKMADTRDNPTKNAARWFLLAGIAGALNDARANNFTLSALSFSDAAGKKTVSDNARYWGRLLGIGGTKLMSSLEAEWPAKERGAAYEGAIESIAPLDLKKAQVYLETLKQLEQDPEYKKARAADENANRGQQVASESANTRIVKALAATDPAAALAMIEKDKGFDWNLRDSIARSAWRAGKFDLVAQTLRPALEQQWSPAGTMARFATMAESFDKELAGKLWAKSEERLKQNQTQMLQSDSYRDYSEMAEFAFYRSPFTPALSRLRLETTWPEARPTGTDQVRANRWSHHNLISAMISLDPLRALEMMAESDDNGRRNARNRIIAYLLADDKERALLNADYN